MKIIKTLVFLAGFGPFLAAQSPADLARQMVVKTVGQLRFGISKSDFIRLKPNLPIPEKTMSFRDEIVEVIEKDGVRSVTYYLDLDGQQPLYEMIVEFSGEELRAEVSRKLYGSANHPTLPDHWVLGDAGGVVSIAWAFDSKLVIAANVPGSEWVGEAMFKLPAGFQVFKKVAAPTEWAKNEVDHFFNDLQAQIDEGRSGFKKIKGDSVNTYFECKLPIGMAEMSGIIDDGSSRLAVNNVMVSGMTPENAVNWQLEMSKLLDGTKPDRYQLVRSDSRILFGNTADTWSVFDKTGKRTGLQVGLLVFGTGQQNVFLLVLQE